MVRIGRDRKAIFEYEDALLFEIQESQELLSQREGYLGKTLGVVHPILKWNTELVKEFRVDRSVDRKVLASIGNQLEPRDRA
jgi:hypothetical protein